ncbi:hypothetical protein NFI96_026878 [Prochilodus magdalenae]|nr:hypothetical protein NFI96_026878 [Prochilodus magdalenae]
MFDGMSTTRAKTPVSDLGRFGKSSKQWLFVYEPKHLIMQAAPTDVSEKTGRSQELREFLCGTVIGCHLAPSPVVKFPPYYISHSPLSVGLEHSGSDWERQQLSHDLVDHVH